MSISQRELAGTVSGAGARKTTLPTRVLGKTGERVSILAFGAGSRFLKYADEDQCVAALIRALDMGITYIDTADNYGQDHLSEQRVGMAIRGRREQLFLASKLTNRDGRESQRIVEESLRALQVDQVDLLQIHSLTDASDLAAIESKDGVLDQIRKVRDQKLTRFIGITSHADPVVLKTALERHDFDCTLMALNAARLAMKSTPDGAAPDLSFQTSFESEALPVAIRKGMGVLAMKAFAQDALIGRAPLEKLLYYALSLPVASLVVSMPKLEHIDEDLRLAQAFEQLPAPEMAELSERLSGNNLGG
jgi:uncharacterized protein